jgi:hypothetical protein
VNAQWAAISRAAMMAVARVDRMSFTVGVRLGTFVSGEVWIKSM